MAEEKETTETKIPKLQKKYYLYDDDLSGLKDLSYTHALKYKIGLCERLIRILLAVDMYNRDSTRIGDVIRARSFNEDLLEELK